MACRQAFDQRCMPRLEGERQTFSKLFRLAEKIAPLS
jgi:hypothetical protein